MGEYDDIINLPHHQSKKRKHMSIVERAAQFGAFKALTGYEDEVYETARYTDEKSELDEYAKATINFKLQCIEENIDKNLLVSITHFVPDERKNGGMYVTVKDTIKKIDEMKRICVLSDGDEILIDNIYEIESDAFNPFVFL